ncbi:MAG: exodeoxyribonuclease large subunit, partial [Burkholderiales bacterium]|nr:exodeoxyribonuclease large subunit [Burkholderiales bacterium]
LKHLNPLNQLQEKHARLKNITYRISAALERLLYQRKNRLEIVYAKLLHNKINLEEHNALLNRLYKQLNNTFSQLLASKEQKIFNVARHLELVNPRNILSRGYAIVKNKNNQIIYSSNDLKQYEKLNIILRDDEINVIVEKSSFQDKLF